MLFRVYTLVFFIFVSLLTGCEASFSVSTASLSEAVLALEVDDKTQAPVKKADKLTPETQTIYATVKVSYAPAETKVKAVFFYNEGGERQIAEDTVSAEGTQYISFSLSPPADGWPVGDYHVQFYLDDKPKDQLKFTVQPAQVVEQNQPAPPPQVQNQQPVSQPDNNGFTRLTENRFGFSFEVPASWAWKLIPNTTDYFISGPDGTEAGEISVIIQIIDTRMGGVNSLKEQMVDLVNQFSQIAGSQIVKKDVISASGQDAPFFIVTYPAKNSRGESVEFGHTQMGLDHSPYLLLISYSAPRDIYQNNLHIFQHMMDSLVLSTPQG